MYIPKLNKKVKELLIANNIPLAAGGAYLFLRTYNLDVTIIDIDIRSKMNVLGIINHSLYTEDSAIVESSSVGKTLFNEVVKQSVNFNVTDFCKDYMSLFPAPKLTMPYIRRAVSGNGPEVIKRMTKFFKDWKLRFGEDVSNEVKSALILDATKAYIEDRRKVNWMYCKKNSKFISDQDGSMLESWIHIIKSGTKTTSFNSSGDNLLSNLSGR